MATLVLTSLVEVYICIVNFIDFVTSLRITYTFLLFFPLHLFLLLPLQVLLIKWRNMIVIKENSNGFAKSTSLHHLTILWCLIKTMTFCGFQLGKELNMNLIHVKSNRYFEFRALLGPFLFFSGHFFHPIQWIKQTWNFVFASLYG